MNIDEYIRQNGFEQDSMGEVLLTAASNSTFAKQVWSPQVCANMEAVLQEIGITGTDTVIQICSKIRFALAGKRERQSAENFKARVMTYERETDQIEALRESGLLRVEGDPIRLSDVQDHILSAQRFGRPVNVRDIDWDKTTTASMDDFDEASLEGETKCIREALESIITWIST